MSDAFTPEELRYTAISFFGLIVFSTILKMSGVANTKYNPVKPSASNVTTFQNRSALDTLMEPSLSAGPSQSSIDLVIDAVLTPIQIPVDILLMWLNIWDVMGWASVFLIVPMLIMIVVIVRFIIHLLAVIIPG